MKHWTSLVSPAQFDELMQECASRTRTTAWSTHKSAGVGNAALFYATAPHSSFVAKAIITKRLPYRSGDRWHQAEMGQLERLPTFYHIRDAKQDFPDWGWLKTPISSVRVPDAIIPKLLQKLSVSDRVAKTANGSSDRAGNDIVVPDDDANPPDRVRLVTTRVVRASLKAAKLKKLYDYECQCCGTRLDVPGGTYVEVHHLKPLGREHRGMDNWDNMIVLCPNCHTRFDLLALAIHPKSATVESLHGKRKLPKIRCRGDHQLSPGNVLHHWQRFMSARSIPF